MKKLACSLTLTTLCLLNFEMSAQWIGFDEIDDSKVAPWIAESLKDYELVYHFGDSEMESDFALIVTEDKCYAQISYGRWSDDGLAWVKVYENLKDVKIIGNKFYSDITNGEFVTYNNGREKIKGLKVYKPWSGVPTDGDYEIGTESYKLDLYFSGDYTQASQRILTHEELKQFSKKELQIMRNEIFARYGYIFKSGGQMEEYFSNKEWFSPDYEDVSNFITELEKENIEKIKIAESQ